MDTCDYVHPANLALNQSGHPVQVKAQYQSTNKFADASGTISSFTIAPECGYTAAVAGR